MCRWILLVSLASSVSLMALGQSAAWQPSLTTQQTYTMHRSSSADPTGANADSRKVAPGETLTVLDADGPGTISHIWFTIADNEAYHLKRIVLRIYWDGEATPSVEAPDRRFFRAGAGRLSQLAFPDAVGGQRKGPEQLFPHAFRQACPHHRHQ